MRLFRYLVWSFDISSLLIPLVLTMPVANQSNDDVWWQSRVPSNFNINIEDLNIGHVDLDDGSEFSLVLEDPALTRSNDLSYHHVQTEAFKGETQYDNAPSDSQDGYGSYSGAFNRGHRNDSSFSSYKSDTTLVNGTVLGLSNFKRDALESYNVTQAPGDEPYEAEEDVDTLYETDSDTGGGFVHGETAGAVASGPTSGGAVSGSVVNDAQGSTSSFCGLTGCTSAAQSSNKNGTSAFAVSSSTTFADGSTLSITSRLKKWFYV
ncbi:hypothetical protein PGQ11_010988 [Apiospora arundinis]|uniref:Uncharacterized protein n=1 Tax=Apiospora arundinis TaxID=335852 RepID=A0ABR2HYW7_9PEZI